MIAHVDHNLFQKQVMANFIRQASPAESMNMDKATAPTNEPNHCFKHSLFNQDCDLCYEASKKYEKEMEYQNKMDAFATAPAVEPQPTELCNCGRQLITGMMPWWCQNCNKPITHRKPEAGSTRPEMPPLYSEEELKAEGLQASTIHYGAEGKATMYSKVSPEMPPAIEPWPKIWAVRGKFGSNVSFFNKESAERYIAERVNPEGFLMTEYVPLAASVQQEPFSAEHKLTWSEETMQIINKLTPDIKGKAFDIEWFLLRQRFEEFEYKANQAQARTQPAPKCPKCGSRQITANYAKYRAQDLDMAMCRRCGYAASGDLSPFFAALPEAPPTDKEEPK